MIGTDWLILQQSHRLKPNLLKIWLVAVTKVDNFVLIYLFAFSWTGTIFDFFYPFGMIPEFKELWNIIVDGFTIVESQILVIAVDMLPWSLALLRSKAQMIFKIILILNVGCWNFNSTLIFCLSKYRASLSRGVLY